MLLLIGIRLVNLLVIKSNHYPLNVTRIIGESMKKGYTLIEVMIVIVIIGIIASVIGLAYVGIHFISKFW